MHVLVTRAEPEADACKVQLEALGHRVSIDSLLHIEPLPIAADALAGAAGIVVTSRNSLRALSASPALAAALQLPVITVGPGTAALARELKFSTVIAGDGSSADLVPVIATTAHNLHGPLIHLAGEKVAFDLTGALAARGIDVREIVAYRAVAANSLREQTKALLADGALDGVILMSPRTAETFARLVTAAGLQAEARRLVFLCLSAAVAARLGDLAPPQVVVAETPNSQAMLAATSRVATQSSGV